MNENQTSYRGVKAKLAKMSFWSMMLNMSTSVVYYIHQIIMQKEVEVIPL